MQVTLSSKPPARCSRCRCEKTKADYECEDGGFYRACERCREYTRNREKMVARKRATRKGGSSASRKDGKANKFSGRVEVTESVNPLAQKLESILLSGPIPSSIIADLLDCSPKKASSAIAELKNAGKAKVEDGKLVAVVERPADRAVRESVSKTQERNLRAEHADLVERLKEANARAYFVEAASKSYTPRILAREPLSGLREGVAVALASDWHVEEVVLAEKVAGRNEYNLAIAKQRAKRFFEGLLWLIKFERNAFAMRNLILWIGGDLMTGYIHAELQETNDLSPVQTVLALKEMLSDGIATLLTDKKLEKIIIPWSIGNHGRTTEKRRVKTGAENSFEWLLGNIMKGEWKHEPRVEFHVDRSAHQYVEVYDKTLHFTHGDELKYGGGVGGLGIPLLKRVPAWDRIREAAYHHIGHFHQFRDFGRAICNGSLIGASEYSVSIGADFEPPQQAFYVFDKEHGKTQVTPIWTREND